MSAAPQSLGYASVVVRSIAQDRILFKLTGQDGYFLYTAGVTGKQWRMTSQDAYATVQPFFNRPGFTVQVV